MGWFFVKVLSFIGINFVFYVLICVVVFYFISESEHKNLFNELMISGFTPIWISYGLLSGSIVSIIVYGTRNAQNKPRPQKDEIAREDDVLLQATVFSQAALFVGLSFISLPTEFEFLRWLILGQAVAFYGLRAYAKVKDNNRFRYYSMELAFFILLTSMVNVLIALYVEAFPKLLVLISAVTVYHSIVTWHDRISKYLRLRYGLEK